MTPRLVAITPGDGRDLMAWLPVVAPWVDAVVVREPGLGELALECLVHVIRDAGALAIVHAKSGAASGDGVHVPEGGAVPRGGLVGASRHSADGLDEAFASGASYAFLSPVWAPTSKRAAGPTLGLDGFVALAAGRPVLALGGVTPERCAALAAKGYGSAVLGGLFRDDVLASGLAARAYRDALGAWTDREPRPGP